MQDTTEIIETSETIGTAQPSQRDEGFTLIELLMAIVVVGVLSAVAVVGIRGLTNNGNNATCQASIDAAKAAVAVHFANNNGANPTTFTQMVTPGELVLASGVANGGNTLTGNGWTITLANDGSGNLTSSIPANCA